MDDRYAQEILEELKKINANIVKLIEIQKGIKKGKKDEVKKPKK